MRHKTRWGLLGLALALICAGRTAWAMAGEHGKGDPKHPISVSTWPAGVSVVANRTDRARGHWVNSSDWFEYEGDAADFNDFLKDYAKVPHAVLYLDTKKHFLGLKPNMSLGYDWEMNVCGWGTASVGVTLYVDGRIRLKDLRVPPEVSLQTWDTADTDVAKFAAAHKARQTKSTQRTN